MEERVFKIGFGYDVHRLAEGRALVLGGVTIPHSQGLLGHSDADVLTHALIDGILGALGRGDIGTHFPDTDPAYKDVDSLLLLDKTMEFVRQDGYAVNNVDATITAQRPKLASYIPDMRSRMAELMGVSDRQVNIKATTTEGLGFSGRQEGIEAFAVVSLTGAPRSA
jgi:2-C-methyl-D-erythritol 2,4-cyclodiphosphate synthase